MTNHEMRVRLAEAQGWTDIMVPGPRPRMGEDVTGMPPEGHRPGYYTELPDPLENDRDAAMLRAWCVGQGWTVKSEHTPVALTIVNRAWPAVMVRVSRAPVVVSALVRHADEPDPCRRERLALCRAVLQAIEAGGEA